MIFNNMKRILFVTHTSNQFISIETKLPPLHYCVRVVGSYLYVHTSLVDDTVQTPTRYLSRIYPPPPPQTTCNNETSNTTS